METNNLDNIVDDFNIMMSDLIHNIADICPNTIIGNNVGYMEKLIKKKDNNRKLIDLFISKVLIYKPQIDEGNDDFFLNKSYDDDITTVDTNKNSEYISGKIFEFKDIWFKLKYENKQLIIQYMQLLCQLSQEYFMIVHG